MAGVYKQKECPQCHVIHRKRGKFCSQACSNSHRDVSVITREKLSKVATEYKQTPEGIADTKKLVRETAKRLEDGKKRERGEYVLQEDDWYVLPEGEDPEDFRDNDNWQEIDNDNTW